jgi:hypothetical protein
VHTAIGAPGDGQLQGRAIVVRLAEHCPERPLELLLHRTLAGLPGPAGEVGSVVLDRELGDQVL